MGTCFRKARSSKAELVDASSGSPICSLRSVSDDELSVLKSTSRKFIICLFTAGKDFDKEQEDMIVRACTTTGMLGLVCNQQHSIHVSASPYLPPAIFGYFNNELIEHLQLSGLPTSDRVELNLFLEQCSLLCPPLPIIKSGNRLGEVMANIVNDDINIQVVFCDLTEEQRKCVKGPRNNKTQAKYMPVVAAWSHTSFVNNHFVGRGVVVWYVNQCQTRSDLDAFVQYKATILMEHRKDSKESILRYLEAFNFFLERQDAVMNVWMNLRDNNQKIPAKSTIDKTNEAIDWINELHTNSPNDNSQINNIQSNDYEQTEYNEIEPKAETTFKKQDLSNVCEINANSVFIKYSTKRKDLMIPNQCNIHNVVFTSPSGIGHYKPNHLLPQTLITAV